jgi:hypothetical protein
VRLADRLWVAAKAHPVVAVALVLAFVFFELQMSILAAAAFARPTSHTDPFIHHQAIAPGQSVIGLRDYGCDLGSDMWIRGGSTSCQPDRQQSGLMLILAMTTNHEDISQLSFRAEGVYVGDLVARWGQPDSVRKRSGMFYVTWGDGVSAFVDPVNPAAEFIDLLPIASVIMKPSG